MIAVGRGLDTLRALAGPMRAVAARTFALAAYLFDRMVGTRHGNGRPVFRVYADAAAYRRADEQGGVVNFNVLRADGGYVGYNEASTTLNILLQPSPPPLHPFHNRTGIIEKRTFFRYSSTSLGFKFH